MLGDIAPFVDLICSQPIRQRATIGGNIVNASPIGDMTIMLLALDAELVLTRARRAPNRAAARALPRLQEARPGRGRDRRAVRFSADRRAGRFNFEKVSKRTYLDIASVNSAAWLRVRRRRASPKPACRPAGSRPIPLRLSKTETWLAGRDATVETARTAATIARLEIAPISDVRGSADYKRLLLRQLVLAHFHELLGASRTAWWRRRRHEAP